MNNSRVFTFIVLLLLSTLACQAVNQVLEPEATLAPPPTLGADGATEAPPPEGEPPAVDDGTTAPVATPTLALADTLPAPSLDELGPPPETLEDLDEWLAGAYAANGALSDVCAALQEAQWQQPGDSCEAADLDGDQQEEWLLTLDISHLREDDESIPPAMEGHPGDFWIVDREGVVFMARGPGELDFFLTAPTVVDVVDMTGDDLPEVVTVFTSCGAHTCYYDYHVIGAPDGEIRNLVQPPEDSEAPADVSLPTISMAYVDEEEIRDANEDDLPDLVISGGMVGSAGAGIQRPRTEVWAWDGSAISRDRQEWADTGYRFHTLYNANYDFSQGDYDLAAQKYEATIVDPDLEDVEGLSAPAGVVRDYVRQFAGFRLSLLPLLRGDITESSRWRTWLQDEYPHAPLTEAAQLLYTRWEANGNDLVDACAAVTEYLEAQDNPTGPLTDLGYANPSLTAEEVCPIR